MKMASPTASVLALLLLTIAANAHGRALHAMEDITEPTLAPSPLSVVFNETAADNATAAFEFLPGYTTDVGGPGHFVVNATPLPCAVS